MKKLFPYSLTAILILAIALSGCSGSSGGGGGTQYTLNIAVEGQGTVTPASGTTYPAGAVVDLTATGVTGYALDHWGGTDGSAVAGNKITMDGNKNIVAVFTKLKYDLTVNVSPEGTGTVDTVITLQTKSVYGVEHGQTVQLTAKANTGYMFNHWEGALSGNINPTTLTVDGVKTVTAVFIPWQTINIPMRSVPGPASFPVGLDDSTSPAGTVDHAYLMAETEVTYEQWYTVKTWAVNNGYTFTNSNNAGREGRMGTDGAAPTANKRHPVICISWRDAIVWCNALTEYYNAQNGTNLECAYKSGGVIVKNATDAAACDGVSNGATTTGFRLPTGYEWELAARYRGSDSTNAIEYGGTYWTKGNSASGATADFNDATATGAVAWYSVNGGPSTHSVAGKTPNFLGLYDMSGNVSEWCFDKYSAYERVYRGGSWNGNGYFQRLVYASFNLTGSAYYEYLGFRPVRTQ
jgi:formylglycine-generating enzyme required for sulfatase activity